MSNGNARVIKTGEWVTVIPYSKGYYISVPDNYVYAESSLDFHSEDYHKGYDKAKQDTIDIIQSRLSEIIGDAQPKPILRAELEELIKQIKDEKKDT